MSNRLLVPDYYVRTQQKTGFTTRKTNYDKQGEADKVDPHAGADVALAKRVGAVLEQHYPSQPWYVEVNHAQGVVLLSLPIIMRKNQKFVLHISRLASDPTLRAVVRAAGELLERHNVPRSGFRIDRFMEARDANPINKLRRLLLTA